MLDTTTAPPPAKRHRHGDLKNALKSATRAILDEGEVPGLREAARRCNVSATAAYRHYESYDALMGAVAREGFAELGDLLMTWGKDRAPAAYVKFANENQALFRLMFSGPLFDAGFHSRVADVIGGTSSWAFVHGIAALVVAGQLTLDEALRRAA